MADKKITDLNSVQNLSQNDVFVVVTSSTGTPITKKITARDIFKLVPYATSAGTAADRTGAAISGVLTSNINSTDVSGSLLAGGLFSTTLGPAGNVHNQYGLVVSSTLVGPGANVITEHAAAKFTIDVSNTANAIHTSGLIIGVTNTTPRLTNTLAFLDFRETSNATAQTTQYLFVANNITQNLNSSGNTLVMLANSTVGTTADRKLKIRLNGVNYWLLLSSNAT